MRIGPLLVVLFCVTPVAATELPFSGVYGDELGCARVEPGNFPDEPGGINVYADRIEGYEWGCSWGDVWVYPASNDTLFGVQGLCGGEGIPFLEQYIIELGIDDPTKMTVFAANGDPRWELDLCQGSEPGRKG